MWVGSWFWFWFWQNDFVFEDEKGGNGDSYQMCSFVDKTKTNAPPLPLIISGK